MSNPISQSTFVSLSVVIVCLGAAFSLGIMFWKVEGLREQMTEIKVQVATIDSKLDQVLLSKTNVSLK